MKLIGEKYRKLNPDISLLGDEVVIAQAWKKTHAYMRSRNWYADTLALDISALGIETAAKQWGAQLLGGTPIELEPMELVPAAKSEPWVVDGEKGWIPKADQESSQESRTNKPPIRPLAHLTVRDQTWATAVMLCLADKIETQQGDCSRRSEQDFFKHMKEGVYSYGNRLICDWDNGDAWFRWGNAECYRKFFTDYQSFLKRPVVVGRSVSGGRGDSTNVYVVALDISRFYDRIDRKKLIERLRKQYPEPTTPEQSSFWVRVEQVLNWKWNSEAQLTASELNIDLGNGLPQGLVSAGFYANAYLLDFDQSIGDEIGTTRGRNLSFAVHDYCRYVDDLRLVISCDEVVDLGALQQEILHWIE